jgi:hypothetical protein
VPLCLTRTWSRSTVAVLQAIVSSEAAKFNATEFRETDEEPSEEFSAVMPGVSPSVPFRCLRYRLCSSLRPRHRLLLPFDQFHW